MYLGIDIGTSGVKAVLCGGDDGDTVISQATGSLTVSRPHPLWSEQDPKAWWVATNEAIAGIRAEHGDALSAVRAVGLSGQMHGATLIDASGAVLRPAILWNDGRSEAQCAVLERRQPQTRTITGNVAMPGFTAPKLLWVAENEPDLFGRIDKVLLPKDYIRWLMTGAFVSEMSDAAGTLWLDVAARDWSDAMLEATGLTRAHMPSLVEGSAPSGHLKADVAEAWGVHAFCHCLPGTWHQMSVILSAASCLEWVARMTGFESEAAALTAVEKQTDGPCNEIFLPYLSGERTPHNDPNAKGVFFGLTHGTDRHHLVRAVLEGVAFAFADGQDALIAAGAEIDTVSVIGGGARSRFWGGILASVLARPLTYHTGGELGPAFGAARLARLADIAEDPRDVCLPPPVSEIVEPDAALVEAYGDGRRQFDALYPLLKKTFAEP